MNVHENGKAGFEGALTRALTVAADLGDVLQSFDDFLAVALDDRPLVPIQVPEWGGKTVYLRAMGSRERDEWNYRFFKDDPFEPDVEKRQARERETTYGERLIGSNALLVARCLVNATGARVFRDDQADFLEERNAAVVNRLADKCFELNGWSTAATDQRAEDVSAGKDGSATPSDASSSGSPGS